MAKKENTQEKKIEEKEAREKRIQLKPSITEKAVMLVESQNTLTFKLDKNISKTEIKKEIEEIFKVKVEKIRTLLKNNKKIVYIKLKKEFPAIDVATKLGII